VGSIPVPAASKKMLVSKCGSAAQTDAAQNSRPRPDLRANATEAEQKLWRAIRDRRLAGVKFRRQVPIGPFIADFCCREHALVIELDGGQHADSSYDERRSKWLTGRGDSVLRLWNNEVLQNLDGVLEVILIRLKESET
jgi:very-short-patch-repair endonuclease